MKLSPETIAILKNFSLVNPSIRLTPGNLIMTKNFHGSIYAEHEAKDEIDETYDIFDLGGFLNVLSIAPDGSEIKLSADKTEIEIESTRVKLKYPLADSSARIVVPAKRAIFPEANVSFEMSSEDYQQLMKATRTLGATTITIENDDSGKIAINAYNKSIDPNFEKPVYKVLFSDYTGNAFKYIISLDNLVIQSGAYQVELWASGDRYATFFKSESASYIIAVELKSFANF